MGNRIESDVWTQPTGVVTTRFAYDGGNVWADMDGSNTLQTRYLHGDNADQMLARVSSSGVAAWFNVDRQGSLRNVSDNVTGAVLDTITYDGFGNILNESNAANGGVYKYAGYRFDNETGLYRPDASARYYDPLTGRWTGQDPIGFMAGDGNLQRYVGNNPTNGTDPSGKVPNPAPIYNAIIKQIGENEKLKVTNIVVHQAVMQDINDSQEPKAIGRFTIPEKGNAFAQGVKRDKELDAAIAAAKKSPFARRCKNVKVTADVEITYFVVPATAPAVERPGKVVVQYKINVMIETPNLTMHNQRMTHTVIRGDLWFEDENLKTMNLR